MTSPALPQFLFFTEVSPLYRDIFDRHFFPSYASEFSQCSSLLARDSANVQYGSEAFQQQMLARAKLRAEAAEKHRPDGEFGGTVLVYCDSDIRFYPGARAALRDAVKPGSIYCSADSPTIACGGFMAFIPSLATSMFFSAIPGFMEKYSFEHDQAAMNHELFPHRSMLERLPPTFWTHGLAGGDPAVWDGQDPAALPPLPASRIVMHHANFTLGAQNKMRLLDHYAAAMNPPADAANP